MILVSAHLTGLEQEFTRVGPSKPVINELCYVKGQPEIVNWYLVKARNSSEKTHAKTTITLSHQKEDNPGG